MKPRRVRVLTRRAGDLLLMEHVAAGGPARGEAAVAHSVLSGVVECAAVVVRRDGSHTPMRLRLPRQWVDRAACVQPADDDTAAGALGAVNVRQYGGIAALRLSDVARSAGVVSGASVPAWLERARQLIRQSVRAPIAMRRVAEQVGVHPVHLSRMFRRHFGMTASAYLAQLKLEHACLGIMDGAQSMSSVAYECGFADQSHMSRSVAAALVLTPVALRRRSTAASGP
jgi:AraC-like DNA-binding protein